MFLLHAGSGYLNYVNLLNQAVMMSTQLYNDAANPAHHKYTAHQVALLYVSTQELARLGYACALYWKLVGCLHCHILLSNAQHLGSYDNWYGREGCVALASVQEPVCCDIIMMAILWSANRLCHCTCCCSNPSTCCKVTRSLSGD